MNWYCFDWIFSMNSLPKLSSKDRFHQNLHHLQFVLQSLSHLYWISTWRPPYLKSYWRYFSPLNQSFHSSNHVNFSLLRPDSKTNKAMQACSSSQPHAHRGVNWSNISFKAFQRHLAGPVFAWWIWLCYKLNVSVSKPTLSQQERWHICWKLRAVSPWHTSCWSFSQQSTRIRW